MNLTKKQKQVFDFICNYNHENGFSPTQTEIQAHFGFKSLGSVQDYIRYLTNAGYLKSSPNAVRGLEPVDAHAAISKTEQEIPLMGKVAAGLPLEVVPQETSISVPLTMLKTGHEYFALEVSGESMIEDGIFDGDVLVVKSQKTAHQGETIIALINNEATVKRFHKRGRTIELHPANGAMGPIIVKQGDFKIAGVIAGLIRLF